MRWLADECAAARLVAALRDAGHDVLYAAEAFPSIDDIDVLECARRERRLLLTEDKDFGELIFGVSERRSVGVVLLRIHDELSHMALSRVQQALDRFGNELFGAFTVIEERRFRVRRFE